MTATPGKARSLVQVALAYLVALVASLATGWAARDLHPLLVVALADLTGTAVICVFSRAHDNTSLYDAYWSVAPIPIALYLAWVGQTGVAGPPLVRVVAVCALVALWGNRLTYSWARGWPGMHHEDWRYADLRPRTGRVFWPASFAGFQLFPTVIVFLGCLPLYPALVAGTAPPGLLDAVALTVTLGAIWIEATADRQLNRFVRRQPPPGAILDSGLWRYSRHPNYFGEVSFWWGLFLFGLAAAPGVGHWWIVAGPAAMTALFLLVSIPLIDRRMLARRPGYAERVRRVSRLVPWFPGDRGAT